MPAITLGLAEVEERLHVLRRRLNTVTVLYIASIGLSVVLFAAAGLVVLGLRASAPTFRVAAWTTLLLCLGTAAVCALAFRRRWLGVEATARLVDQRGILTDRLATLHDLHERPRPSRLTSVLITQAFLLGDRWQPQRVVPRRVPKSILLPLVALLALAASPLVAPPPPPLVAARVAARQSGLLSPAVPSQTTGQAEPATGGEGGGGGAGTLQPSTQTSSRADLSGSGSATVGAASKQAAHSESLVRLPDRLQNAIRRAFHASARQAPRQRLARAGSTSGDALHGHQKSSSEGGSGKGHAPDLRPGTAHSGKGEGRPSDAHQQHSGERIAERHRPSGASGSPYGHSPSAGNGSSPGGLMGAQAYAQASGHGAPETFKITISSFLRAVEHKERQLHRSGKAADLVGGGAFPGGVPAALNDQQRQDDALQRAQIPTEYEDIVRRVYSLRDDR